MIPRPPGVRAGGTAPWPVRDAPITVDEVRASFEAAGPPGGPPRTVREGATLSSRAPSAVLVPIFPEDQDARVILTRRSSRLRSHTGQVAFPGGRLDEGESPVAGALRESAEEIGLDPATCEIVGELSPLVTITSGASIVPFVGILPGRPRLRPNPAEVERVFDVPLAELTRPEVYREEIWPLPEVGDRSMYIYELDGDTVWGATARMLTELLDRILGGEGLGPDPAEGYRGP